MKIRRMAALLLSIMLMLSLFPCALADEVVREPDLVISNAYVTLDQYTNTLVVTDYDIGNRMALWTADGQQLTEAKYSTMTPRYGMFEIRESSGVNTLGMMDSTGKIVVPMEYGDVFYISDRWQAGAYLVSATADNYDYKSTGSDGTTFYLVDRYDIYFCGSKVGELGRLEFDSYSAYARGDYLYVQDKERNYTYYNKEFVASGYSSTGSAEYDVVKNKVYHKGSGQQAFTSTCTLTSDEVQLDIYEIDGRFLDLQGNVVFTPDPKYTSIYNFVGDYARVYMSSISKYGLIDRTGREILACEYDSPYSVDDEYFLGGYQPVVKDDKFGFVNAAGEVTCEFKYGDSVVKSTSKTPFTYLNNLDGTIIVLSGAVGELPTHYAEISLSKNGSPLFAAEITDGNAGVVNLLGETVIPFDETYDDTYDLSISADGSVVVGNAGSRVYNVYLMTEEERGITASTTEEEQPAEQPAQTGDVPADNAGDSKGETSKGGTGKVGTWKCSNGHTSTGKFCSECGEARPVEETVVKCAKCGYQPEEGKTPKFCPECGNAF